MDNSGSKLKTLRLSLGLSQLEMGKKIGVSSTAVCKYEKGILQTKPNSPTIGIIENFLADFAKNGASVLSHSLDAGKCYVIFSDVQLGDSFFHDRSGDLSERFYVFRYVGKQGIHHCFKETRSGWSRTYTDSQLIGKHIQRVSEYGK